MSLSTARRGAKFRKWVVLKPDIIVTAIWLIVGLWGWLWLGPTWVAAMRPARDRLNDFYQDWGSARNHVVGLPVYTHHETSVPRHLDLPSNPVPSIEYNAHPPTSVLLALPLARLDYPDAVLVWNVISLFALAVGMRIVAAELGLPWTLLLPTLALLAFCHPVYGNIYQGQLTLILVLLVTTIWALERSGRLGIAGVFLGAAAAIKLFPAYLAVYYIARGRLQPLLAATGSFLALTLVTVFVLGMDTYYDYVTIVMPYQDKFRSFGYNLSIPGLWHKLFNPVAETGPVESLWFNPAVARWGSMVSDLAITAIVATLAYGARTRGQRDFAFASVITAMLLVSPVTWDFSLPLLLVPVALIGRAARNSQWMATSWFLFLAIAWIPQSILMDVAQGGHSYGVFSWRFMLGAPSLKFYASLGIFVLGLAALWGEKSSQKKETEPNSEITGRVARKAVLPLTLIE
jgi:alpha-1,2-mannosyltransferase